MNSREREYVLQQLVPCVKSIITKKCNGKGCDSCPNQSNLRIFRGLSPMKRAILFDDAHLYYLDTCRLISMERIRKQKEKWHIVHGIFGLANLVFMLWLVFMCICSL